MPAKKRVNNKSTGRSYVQDTKYESTPEQKKRRAARNKARRAAIKSGAVAKGSTLDVHHPTGNPKSKKTKVISRSKNRGIK